MALSCAIRSRLLKRLVSFAWEQPCAKKILHLVSIACHFDQLTFFRSVRRLSLPPFFLRNSFGIAELIGILVQLCLLLIVDFFGNPSSRCDSNCDISPGNYLDCQVPRKPVVKGAPFFYMFIVQ